MKTTNIVTTLALMAMTIPVSFAADVESSGSAEAEASAGGYIKLGDIKGESNDRVNAEVTVTKELDKSSPKIAESVTKSEDAEGEVATKPISIRINADGEVSVDADSGIQVEVMAEGETESEEDVMIDEAEDRAKNNMMAETTAEVETPVAKANIFVRIWNWLAFWK